MSYSLIDKDILVISPERWGANFISKHNYALELAKSNNVWFLNSRGNNQIKDVKVTDSDHKNLKIVEYGFPLRGIEKLPLWLLKVLNRRITKRLLRQLPAMDVVWSFDQTRFFDLSLFEGSRKIYHPVDITSYRKDIKVIAASSADLVLYVSSYIADELKGSCSPVFMNHGLSDPFINAELKQVPEGRIVAGYVGTLMSKWLHQKALLTVVKQNPEIEFRFIGPYGESNLGQANNLHLVEELKKLPNIVLMGVKTSSQVAKELASMHVLLSVYDSDCFPRQVSNSHKLLEYLSSGRAIISNYVKSYENEKPGLIYMCKEMKDYPEFFKERIEDLNDINSMDYMEMRRSYALSNSYSAHIKKVEQLLSS